MVSYSGYWQYQNIIQAEAVPKKEVCYARRDTISGYLADHPEFQLFHWIIKKADMDRKMADEQFNATLFAVTDTNLYQQFGSKEAAESYFVKLDKNQAYNILYAHLLERKIHKKTLMGQRLTKLFTKNEKTELYFLNNYGDITINNLAHLVQSDLEFSNGIIHIVDRLLIPVF